MRMLPATPPEKLPGAFARCRPWRIMEGMLVDGWDAGNSKRRGRVWRLHPETKRIDIIGQDSSEFLVGDDAHPVVTDAATFGCIEELVRQAWKDDRIWLTTHYMRRQVEGWALRGCTGEILETSGHRLIAPTKLDVLLYALDLEYESP